MPHNPARGRDTSRVTRGVDADLESRADAILKSYRDGISQYSNMKDFLTPNQYKNRLRREIYTSRHAPEKKIVSGIFKRSYAPPRRKGPRETG